MAMIYVKDAGDAQAVPIALPDPSKMEWGLQDVSDSEAGRTQDGLMHKNRIAQKRKLTLEWPAVIPAVASQILQAVNPEYLSVTYFDAMSGQNETRTMYVGDRSAPVLFWIDESSPVGNKKYFASVKFNLIEQ